MIDGQYNRNGYKVFRDGAEVYTAGNSPQDSTAQESDPHFAVPLATLAKYCRQTIKDMAAEFGEKAGYADQVEDDFDEQEDRAIQRERYWFHKQ